MCGIIGYVGTQPALPRLLTGLSRLEYRGYDSAGIAVADDSGICAHKRQGRLSALEKDVKQRTFTQKTGIGHTRWATHGAPDDINAHPHMSFDGRCAVVHNGMIENYAALKAELQQEGVTFRSDTDTEVVAHLLAKHYKGDFRRAVAETVARLNGAYALGILCRDFPHELFAVRRASPLVVGVSADGGYIASDVTALLPFTRRVMLPEEGDMVRVTADGIAVWEESGKLVNRPFEEVTWSAATAEKGDYPHYMLKEMWEQPAALAATLAPHLENDGIRLPELAGFPACGWVGLRRICMVACGSAYHAAMVGKYVVEKWARLPVEVDLASEFRYREQPLDERTLTVVISQSGETADTLAALRKAKRCGSPVLAIVNVTGSTIARESDRVLYTQAGPEVAVATTKGYTTQVAMLFLLGGFLARQRGELTAEAERRLTKDLRELPALTQETLTVATVGAAKWLSQARDVYFIGRGIGYAVALEGALKLKEISYIHAEGYAAGELKHGTISLVEEGTPVVVLGCGEVAPEKTLSNLREVTARGARVLAVTTADLCEIYGEAAEVLTVPTVSPQLSAIPVAVVLQLLAYYTALERGCDIDKPRNLAKSVTVE